VAVAHIDAFDEEERSDGRTLVYPPAMDQDYARFHRDPGNMLIHIVAVPAFIYGTWLVLSGVLAGRWLGAVFGLAAIGVSLAVQGIGHKREPTPPLPFDGPGDFIKRILTEQFYRFPMFVLTGGWFRALRSADH